RRAPPPSHQGSRSVAVSSARGGHLRASELDQTVGGTAARRAVEEVATSMRVLLTHPPLNAAREVTPPLGLCTLAAWLRHQGHEVRILDLDLEIKGRQDGQQTYLGLLARGVSDFSPAAVGITSMYNNSLQAERMARTVKACDPSIVTIGGGSHFGALGPRALRRIPELDYAIEGEGEQAFSALLAALECGAPVSQIPRLHYRMNGEIGAN